MDDGFFIRWIGGLNAPASVIAGQRSQDGIEDRHAHEKAEHTNGIKEINDDQNNGMKAVRHLQPFAKEKNIQEQAQPQTSECAERDIFFWKDQVRTPPAA